MSAITTHVLDTAIGCPAVGISVVLEQASGSGWAEISRGVTNSDGRVDDLWARTGEIPAGVYRLTFHTGQYLKTNHKNGFYPYISIVFEISSPTAHYHVPVLLSAFGYTTYRGS